MFVYLKYHERYVLVTCITLQNGCKPVTGTGHTTPELEPAVWFKSLLIEFMIIDCDMRLVRWVKSKCDHGKMIENNSSLVLHPPPTHSRVAACYAKENMRVHTMFDDDVSSYCNAQATELFVQANALCEMILKKCEDSNQEYDLQILHFVHSYILPSLVLRKNDEDNLNEVLKYIESCTQSTDADIRTLDTKNIENFLSMQREQLVKDFQREGCVRLSSADFLITFLQHLDKDINSKQSRLNGLQYDVDASKNHGTAHSQSIETARKERNNAAAELEKYIFARENIRNFICRPFRDTPYHLTKIPVKNKVHVTYFIIGKRLALAKENLKKLFLQKVKLVNMKHAINMTIGDLKTREETVGIEVIKGTTTLATDILSSPKSDDKWITLKECIGELLASDNCVREQHRSFCLQVVDRIDATIKENDLFKIGDNNLLGSVVITSTLKTGEPAKVRKESNHQKIFEKANAARIRNNVVRLVSDIIHHIETICAKIRKSLNRYTSDIVRIHYEEYFYPIIWKKLFQVYIAAHEPTCKCLMKEIPGKTLEETNIDYPWMRKREQSADTDSMESVVVINNRNSGLSTQSIAELEINIPLLKCSAAELYKLVERQCKLDPSPYQHNFPIDLEEHSSQEAVANTEERHDEDGHDEIVTFVGFDELFKPALELIRSALEMSNIEDVLKQLTKAYRFTSDLISELFRDKETLATCDDIVSTFITMFTYMNEDEIGPLHACLNIASDFISPCHRGNVFDCCLTTLYSAMQYHEKLWV